MANKGIVIYDKGKVTEAGKRIDPRVLELVLLDDITATLAEINEHGKKEEFEGKEDPRTLSATDELKYINLVDSFPFKPWISAYFINDGPDTVRIAINRPYRQFEMRVNETVTVDRSHADERIGIIFYGCNTGKIASVRVTGEY